MLTDIVDVREEDLAALSEKHVMLGSTGPKFCSVILLLQLYP